MIMNTLKNLLDLVGLSKSDVFFIHSIIPLIKKNNNSMLLCNCKGPHYDHRKCRRYQIRTLNNNEGKSQCSILIGQKMSILLKLHYFLAKKKKTIGCPFLPIFLKKTLLPCSYFVKKNLLSKKCFS